LRLLLTDKTGHALVIGRHGCPPLIGVVRLERLCVQIGASDLVVLPRHRGYRFRLVRRRVARDRIGDVRREVARNE